MNVVPMHEYSCMFICETEVKTKISIMYIVT